MTIELIETKTLGTAAASIEFTSIPQDGTDLLAVYSLRDSGTNTTERVFNTNLSFNGLTTNFSARILFAANATGSFTETRFAGWHPDAASTSNTFGNTSLYIPNYTGSTNKSYSIDQVAENNETLTQRSLVAGLWSNTAAITSITFTTNGSNLVSGSTISLYKITKGTDGIVTVT